MMTLTQLRARHFIAFFVNSNKPLPSSTFSSNHCFDPHLIKAHWKGLFSVVDSQRTKISFLSPPTSHDFTYCRKHKIYFKTNTSKRGGGWWRRTFWLESTLVMFSSSHYLDEFCFLSGPGRHCLHPCVPTTSVRMFITPDYFGHKCAFLLDGETVSLHFYVPDRHLA